MCAPSSLQALTALSGAQRRELELIPDTPLGAKKKKKKKGEKSMNKNKDKRR